MTTTGARRLAVGALVLQLATLLVVVVLDLRLIRLGYADRVGTVADPAVWPLVAAFLAAAIVGAVVAAQQPGNPVGWLFLGLSTTILLSALVEHWYTHAVVVRPPRLGAADLAGTLADKSFIPWFALVALVLLLTPTGTYLSRRWRVVGRATVATCVGALALSLLSDRPLDDYPSATNPLAVPALNPGVGWAAAVLLLMLAACLVLSGLSLVLRWRRAEGDARRQLLWLALVVVPLPAFVTTAFVAAYADLDALTVAATGGFVTLIPVAAGLSVLRYRLYDVERVVAATLAYSILTALLVLVYVGVVSGGAHLSRGWSPSPVATATVGAVTAALLAAPLRRGLQDRIDRRFNKRAYDAARVVQEGLAVDRAGLDVEALLRSALGDPALDVAYATSDGGWTTSRGAPAADRTTVLDVGRGGRVVARIGYDPELVERETVRRAAVLAAAELDNTRLRAEREVHVGQIQASRERISQAHREERRRIERDLHDGAQQTLLALAFDLQSAQLNGDPDRMRHALASGACSARDAAQQLRELANGLHPQALTEGGLAAVIDDLARRSPVPVRAVAPEARFDPATEFTAWLVVAEAVVNAQKHSRARSIDIEVGHQDGPGGAGHLRIRVADDGHGGADPTSSGLRGLRDRVEAARGQVTISSDGHGTRVEAVIPCGS